VYAIYTVFQLLCDSLLLLTIKNSFLCISSQGQDLYSHRKLNMYIYWFSSKTTTTTTTTPDATVQPLGRHIANYWT